MNQLLKDYQAYYRLRANKYASYPNYKRSFIAEQNLALLFGEVTDLTSSNQKIQELAKASRKAQLLDQAEQQATLYEKNDEPLFADLYQRMFHYIEHTNDDENTSNKKLIEFEQEKIKIILLDPLTVNTFIACFPYLKRYIAERDATPSISSLYKAYHETIVKEEKETVVKTLQSELQQIQNEYPEATYNWDSLLSEKRHRKKIALSDARLKYYIEEMKNLL